MEVNAISSLLIFVFVCMAAATPGIVFRPGEWYRRLAKPSWCPPDWVFGPVWFVLYLSIAVSGWLVWRQGGFEKAAFPLLVYGIQLVLNGLWSSLFFGLRRPDLALIEIAFLGLAIAATLATFYPISPIAGLLLAPYLAWISFAAVLNYDVWRLNRPA